MFKLVLFGIVLVASCTARSAPQQNNDKFIVCYYGSWATYRHGDGRFDVADINPAMCTHLIYGFAGLGTDYKIFSIDPYNDFEENWGKGAFRKFTNLKQKNPKLKTLLAIGGWNEGSIKYSAMASTPESRRIFIDSVIPFLQAHGFDGLDFDWEYPAQRGGVPADRDNYSVLCAELRAEFDKYGFLLTAAVGAGQATMEEAYDIPAISKSFDFINVMTYDFRGAWEHHPYTGHHAPFQAMEIDVGADALLNVKYAMEYWRDHGAPAHKLILGMPTYGRGFTLQDLTNTGFYSPTNVGIPPGKYTGEPGFWGYHEICEELLKGGWTTVKNSDVVGPYSYKGNLWIGYDDAEAIRIKSEWVRDNGFGGAMFWSLETDDFHGKCGEPSALIKAAHRTLIGEIGPVNPNPPPPVIPPPPPPPSPGDGVCTVENQKVGEACAREFYVCIKNGSSWNLVELKCPEPLYYHPEIQNCNWGSAIPCA